MRAPRRAAAASLVLGPLPVLATLGATSPAPAVADRATTARAAATLDRRLVDPRIQESSGLARSTYARRTLWTHNDSGDSARVFAIGREGRTTAVVRLRGAEALDWEDITSGRGHQLWVGDIGDNAEQRPYVSVYRFTEPRRLESTTVGAARFDLVYPDGPHDAEALLVNPTSGRLFVVTKDSSGGVYRAPETLSRSVPNRLTRVASAPPVVTGASFAPDGRRVVLVDYARAYFYRRLGGPSPAVQGKPPLAQGESVEFSRDGKVAFVGSEGDRSPVYRMSAP